MSPAETLIDDDDAADAAGPTPGRTAAARRKLVEMRRALIARLCHRVNGSDLALLGSVQMAIIALDEAAADAG